MAQRAGAALREHNSGPTTPLACAPSLQAVACQCWIQQRALRLAAFLSISHKHSILLGEGNSDGGVRPQEGEENPAALKKNS